MLAEVVTRHTPRQPTMRNWPNPTGIFFFFSFFLGGGGGRLAQDDQGDGANLIGVGHGEKVCVPPFELKQGKEATQL